MNSCRERVCIVAINGSGDSIRFACTGEGRSSESLAGGDEYRVVSNVMRRISHFRRCDAAGSGPAIDGGGSIRLKAEVSSESVKGTLRCRNALAARG